MSTVGIGDGPGGGDVDTPRHRGARTGAAADGTEKPASPGIAGVQVVALGATPGRPISRRGRVDGRDVRRRLRVFIGTALIVLLLIAAAVTFVAGFLAQQQALDEAQEETIRIGNLVVAPLLVEALAGNTVRRDELDRAVHVRLDDGTVSEINIWRSDGTIIYADNPAIIGKKVTPVQSEVPAATDRGQATSEVHLGDEAGVLPADQRFLEVYVPFRLPGQPPLAFEAYYPVQSLDARTSATITELLLLSLLPLTILQLVQIPIAVSLVRRINQHETERAALLDRALTASDRERRRIAADLHDGVVQNLAGVNFALTVLTPVVPADRRTIAESCTTAVRAALEDLRKVIVDIYPPELSAASLPAALDDLLAPLRAAGAMVTVETTTLPVMDPTATAAVYRTAREALVNVAKHAHARTVRVELGPWADAPAHRPAVRLAVIDDGVGLAPDAMARRGDGHIGVHLLIDQATELGGRFTLTSPANGGTIAEALIPTQPTD